jgi:VanZ family protein
MFPGISLLQVLSGICAIALAFASLTPGDEMVRTALPGTVEHVGAYFLCGVVFATAFPRQNLWLVGGELIAYAGLLEFCQLFVHGRHSRFIDFAASSFGIVLGLAVGVLLKSQRSRAQQ